MASLHKQPGRPNYFCAYALADGKRVFRSTGTANEREAKRMMQSWVQAALEARSKDGLTVDRAREIIANGVADIYRSGSGEAMPDSTLGSWIDRWIESKKLETTPATFVRYGNTIKGFKEALKNKLTKPISSITAQDILKWRDARGKVVAAKTINVDLKTVRALFGEAVRAGLVTVNVAGRVKVLKQSETSRRAFGVDEINRLIKMAVGEMKGLIIFGIFTGQRLGDIARLSWRSLDLDNNEIRFLTAKTGKRLAFPLLRPMADYVAALDAPNDPDAPLFPEAHAAVVKEGRVVTLSNQFHALMAVAGLVEKRTHISTGKGRGAKREGGQVSFHSLRHSTVTMLKKAGVSDAMTQQIIGHDSIAVSRGYTHLDSSDVAKAMKKIEDAL
jgi:integrase